MLRNVPMKWLVAGPLLAMLATPVPAVEVTLDSVTAMAPSGETNLRIDGRAKFEFDPDTSTLTAAGTWIAEYVAGPGRMTRFSHKVEDMSASLDGRLSMKSYECVEGTYGAIVVANNCGNYRFGPNMLDDGGAVDDVFVGPRKSLASFAVTALTWDGESLLLIIGTDSAGEAVFPEYSLELRFSAVKPGPTSSQPSVR